MYGYIFFFFFKQKTAYEMRISDWSSDVCSSDLAVEHGKIGGEFRHPWVLLDFCATAYRAGPGPSQRQGGGKRLSLALFGRLQRRFPALRQPVGPQRGIEAEDLLELVHRVPLGAHGDVVDALQDELEDRKSTRLNSRH